MSSRRPYIGPSDSQSNAEALARRGSPYSVSHDISVRRAWDWRKRQPTDLREVVRAVCMAYADEPPMKLHEGPDSIGPDGTPKMTTRAEGYIFGAASGSDARIDPETGQLDALGYFHSPFRAALDNLAHGNETARKRGRIVARIAIDGQGPTEAAIAEGIPAWCGYAKQVAEDALRLFLGNLSDVKVNVPHPRQDTTAA